MMNRESYSIFRHIHMSHSKAKVEWMIRNPGGLCFHRFPDAYLKRKSVHDRIHHMYIDLLVGGLVAIFYFPIYWVSNHPN